MSFPPPPEQGPGQPPQWNPPPAQQPYGPRPDPVWGAPPPRKSSTGLIVTLSVVGGLAGLLAIAGVLTVALGGGSDSSARERRPAVAASANSDPTDPAPAVEPTDDPAAETRSAEADVTLSRCTIDSLTEWPSVDVKITNGTAAAATYIISVEFVDDSGTRVAEGIASASALAPGQTSKQKAQGLGKAPADTKCKVAHVSRFPADE
ncbi:FxLYD domain-containing protein [Streptomyces sp. NPDC006289]|uniref:FxLYD domain-containing protein n=1 Tax=Streptomyces sp. NPDC006289 TaxID=3156744 RepID=UPI0033B0005E